MVPDQLFARLFHIPNLVEIALKHDLKYAYGEQENDTEKLRADLEFELDLLNDGASPRMAKLMFTAVDLGGKEKLNTPYSWAYAHTQGAGVSSRIVALAPSHLSRMQQRENCPAGTYRALSAEKEPGAIKESKYRSYEIA